MSYSGSSGALRYRFSVPNNLPAGRWLVTGGAYGNAEQNIGQGFSVEFTFPLAGTYTVCYEYTDANGCKVRCCRKFCINDPFACNRIVVNPTQGGFNLSLSGVIASNVIQWTNDSQGGVVIGSNTTSIFLPTPPANTCYFISALIFDPNTGCFEICCKQVCGPKNPCGDITDIEVSCTSDLWVSFNLNNTYVGSPLITTTASNDFSMDFILVSANGVGFADCKNVITVEDIVLGNQGIALKLTGCVLPLTPGTRLMIMPVLKQRIEDYIAICCHLEPFEFVIPDCGNACLGESSGETSCFAIFEPVCGCNNITYGNSCEARIAGVRNWLQGPCSSPSDGINNDSQAVKKVQEQAYNLTNAPNPFSGSTLIKFTLPEPMTATISVLDTNGKILFKQTGTFESGLNEVEFKETQHLSSGMYFYRLQTSTEVLTKTMVLSKE